MDERQRGGAANAAPPLCLSHLDSILEDRLEPTASVEAPNWLHWLRQREPCSFGRVRRNETERGRVCIECGEVHRVAHVRERADGHPRPRVEASTRKTGHQLVAEAQLVPMRVDRASAATRTRRHAIELPAV